MDQSTLIKIARLRTMAARHGKAFDVVRFAGDRPFALATLQSVLDTDDEQLLVLGLELMDAFKMVSSPVAPAPVSAAGLAVPVRATPAPAAAAAPVPPTKPADQRYIGRLR